MTIMFQDISCYINIQERKKIKYRPISLMPHISKIFQTLFKNRFSSFIKKYKVILEHQFGLKKNQSTQDAVLELTTKIYKALN